MGLSECSLKIRSTGNIPLTGFRLLVFPLTRFLTLAPPFGLELRAIDCTGSKDHPTVNTCHVIVCNRLSLSMGSRGVAAGANPSLDSEQGQGTPWTSRQPSLMSNVGFIISLKDTQPCPEPGFEPATFQALVNLLYLLSYSHQFWPMDNT